MSATIIVIANHKGGVGKTTSTVSIGAALSIKGKKVLLIDLDAQQSLSYMLSHLEDSEKSVYDTLVKDEPLPIINVKENLDLVPASLELARAEMDLSTRMARESILREHLETVADKYDYIIMDCPPYLGIVTTNALVAAEEIIIPLTAEALPLKGLAMLDDVVREVHRRINPKLRLGGVVVTRYNNRNLNKEVLSTIRQRYADKLFQTKIRENIILAEMPLVGTTIFDYDPKSNGAADYSALADEILDRHNN